MTQGFDEWMNKNHSGAFDMPHQRDAYEAGQQSRQAEIDELQKRIDEALDELQYPTATWEETIYSVINILKGKEDE